MQPPQQQNAQAMSIEQLHNFALNVVHFVCSIFTMPIEVILRPQYGTRYFPIPVTFFSAILMILLPFLSSMATGVTHMIPFSGPAQPPQGLFGLASLSSLYFFLVLLHGLRLWRRMVYMDLEKHSQYEGPPLPFFRLIPGSRSFWFTRIVLEPAFVFVLASVLESISIIQSGLSFYLHVAALMLVVRNYIYWYRVWEMIRAWMDAAALGPIVSSYADGKATEDDLAPVHLASLPKDLSPEVRRWAVMNIVRSFGAAISTERKIQEEKQ
jgi:hypothetical protein